MIAMPAVAIAQIDVVPVEQGEAAHYSQTAGLTASGEPGAGAGAESGVQEVGAPGKAPAHGSGRAASGQRATPAAPQRGSARRSRNGDAALEGLRVLVIDDEAGLQRAIRRVLEKMGCRVSSALTGEDGLRQAQGTEFDLILCDVRMPGLDGRTLYARFEEEVPYARRALVFMTGDVLSDETREFLQEVGSTVLAKPFGREQLFQTIHQHLGLSG
jgi:CheY-like chemotaxis protein